MRRVSSLMASAVLAVLGTVIPAAAAPEGCIATNPQTAESTTCSFDATREGGIVGVGDFTVEVRTPCAVDPETCPLGYTSVTYTSDEGNVHLLGTIRPGDSVFVSANSPGTVVAAGDPRP